jgi:hypothetical protein
MRIFAGGNLEEDCPGSLACIGETHVGIGAEGDPAQPSRRIDGSSEAVEEKEALTPLVGDADSEARDGAVVDLDLWLVRLEAFDLAVGQQW